MPKVSIIIPTLNRASYLQRAIYSVCGQTFRDWELIVVQNGPEQFASAIVDAFYQRGFNVRFLHQPLADAARARNAGVWAARGEYIAFLDDDDQWMPEKLTEQIKLLEKYPRAGLVTCIAEMVNESNEVMRYVPARFHAEIRFEDLITNANYVPSLSSVVVRRACFDTVGVFNPHFTIGNDRDFYIRLAALYRIYSVEKALLRYFHHAGGESRARADQSWADMVSILKGARYIKKLGYFEQETGREGVRRCAGNFRKLASQYAEAGQYGRAAQSFLHAFACDAGAAFAGLKAQTRKERQ